MSYNFFYYVRDVCKNHINIERAMLAIIYFTFPFKFEIINRRIIISHVTPYHRHIRQKTRRKEKLQCNNYFRSTDNTNIFYGKNIRFVYV